MLHSSRLFASLLFWAAGFLFCPANTLAQNVSGENIVVPPPRTITAQPKPAKPSKTVNIYFYSPDAGACTDTFKVEASRLEINPGQNVAFRTSIARKCSDHPLKTPVPVSSSFTVRSLNKKSGKNEGSQSITPSGTAFSFSHVFEKLGTYQVTVVNKFNDVETHTITLTVQVTAPKENAPAPEN